MPQMLLPRRTGSGNPARVLWSVALASRRAAPASRPARATGKGGGTASTPAPARGQRTAAPARQRSGIDAGADRPVIVIDAGADGGGCTSGVTCTPPNGRYCGVIGNGCFGTIDCGACPTGAAVRRRASASAAPSCVPLACQLASGKYCGSVGDGCGRAMDCGGCAADADLQRLRPVRGDELRAADLQRRRVALLRRRSATAAAACSTAARCQAPATCAGRGVAGVCGDPSCKPITCTPAGGGRYCGVIGDGCGGTLDCGTACPGGMTCGAAPPGGVAIPNVCPGTGSRGPCTGIACMVQTCTGTAKTTRQRHDPRPGGQGAALQRQRLRPERAARPDPRGGVVRPVQRAAVGQADRDRADRRQRPLRARERPGRSRTSRSSSRSASGAARSPLASVTACVDNPITDANLTRLPRTKAEGHIPKMALTTGGSDALECLLRKIGIADAEFTTDTGAGRVHLYIGGRPDAASSLGTDRFATTLNGGAVFPNATTLWGEHEQDARLRHHAAVVRGQPVRRRQDAVLRQREAVRRFGRPHLRQPPALQLAVEGPGAVAQTAVYTGGSKEENDPPQPGDRHRRHHVPQGGGAGRLAGRGRRDPDARPDRALRLGALRGAGDAADAALDLPADEPERQRDAPADVDAVHDVQHAGRGGRRRAVRPRRPHRHPRQGGAGAVGREQGQVRSGHERDAVPDRLHVGDAVARRRRRSSSCSSICRRACSPTPTSRCRRPSRRPARRRRRRR